MSVIEYLKERQLTAAESWSRLEVAQKDLKIEMADNQMNINKLQNEIKEIQLAIQKLEKPE